MAKAAAAAGGGAPRGELGAPAGRTVPAAHGLRSGGRSGAKPGRAAAGGGGVGGADRAPSLSELKVWWRQRVS